MQEHVIKLSPTHIRTEIIKPISKRKKERFGPSPLNGCAGFRLVPQYQQRSMVKVSYVKNTSTRSWAAHGDYLQREHAQTPGERGVGFNAENESVDIKSLLKSWQKSGDELFFKVIISPQNGYKMNLMEHARDLVKQMEIDLDTHLEWAAIQHNNTDHPHLHIVIRGVDDTGHALRMPASYISQDIRTNSQILATRELGYLRQQDLVQQREQHIERNCITEIDRSLRQRADEDGIVSYKDRVPDNAVARAWRLQEISRLKYLETLGLATHIEPKVWQLSDKTEETLAELQRQHDISEDMKSHGIEIQSTEELTPTEIIEEEPLTGKIVGLGLSNELYDKRYIIIEGTDGKAHYIHATNNLVKQHTEGDYRNGDIVTLSRETYVNKNDEWDTYLTIRNHGTMHDLKIAYYSKLDMDTINFVKETGQPPTISYSEKSFGHEYAKAMQECFQELKSVKVFYHDTAQDKYFLTHDWEQRYSHWLDVRREIAQEQEQAIVNERASKSLNDDTDNTEIADDSAVTHDSEIKQEDDELENNQDIKLDISF